MKKSFHHEGHEEEPFDAMKSLQSTLSMSPDLERETGNPERGEEPVPQLITQNS
jgi:hypothetical protein